MSRPPFRQAFDAEQASVLDGMELSTVDLSLPKFDIESQVKLGAALSHRGMASPFAADADLDAIHEDAFVSEVFHRVKLAIDERGTVAAAATAVIGAGAGPPPIPIVVTIDRPFLFFIRDRATGAVLFLGQVVTLP